MTYPFDENPSGFTPPLPSTADRSVAVSSKAHFCGHVVIGDGSGRGAISGIPARIVLVESHLELCWCLCLALHRDITDLREQVAFEWFDEDGVYHTHFFDLLVTRTDGSRIACAIRPAAQAGGHFAQQLCRIAAQVRASRFAADVRLLTERDIDPVKLHNAWVLHGVRISDPLADAAAAEVLAGMSGSAALAELTARIGAGVSGFRALLRFVRSGHLRLVHDERITSASRVYKGSNL